LIQDTNGLIIVYLNFVLVLVLVLKGGISEIGRRNFSAADEIIDSFFQKETLIQLGGDRGKRCLS
jgi:hypothetical protein